VPIGGIAWFHDLFNYYVDGDDEEVLSKELQLDAKVFYFDVGVNKRGRFLKISEASTTYSRSTIIVPVGNTRKEGWASFRDILGDISEAALQVSGPSEHLGGLSDDVGAGFLSGGSGEAAFEADTAGDKAMSLPPAEDTGEMVVSKVIRADQKKFFFDLGCNNRGQFLRISEVIGPDRSAIIVPVSALEQFHDVLGHFVDMTRSQGLAAASVANVRTVAAPHRQNEN